ncbi:hypothetical protein U0035_18830 [Niabella yanshanensis]|uniref:SnoaL-like domain-containing protein n=1 Tax=Niabella yanshanensis TaxID=577386 RepID=A0ABZ0W385_9BACT|nr:hypothetical protein [Niabella yanshanensis]WQD37730.1 hypothetical protein U0035_18830 [Niabella yanshanensis]
MNQLAFRPASPCQNAHTLLSQATLSLISTILITGKKWCHLCSLLLGLSFFVLPGCKQSSANTPDEKKLQAEKDAILATIEKETASFFARDYNAWKSTYAQTDYAFQAWSNRDGTFDASVGWNGIDNTVGKYINDNPEPQSSSHPVVERKNIKYKFYGPDACYLTWDQFNSNKEGDNFHHSKEVRVMEKENGQWKIVCVAAFWDYVNPISADRLKDIQRMDKESRGTDKL